MASDSDRNLPALPILVPLTPDEVGKAVCQYALVESGIDTSIYAAEFVHQTRWKGGQLAVSVLITKISPIIK